MHANATPSNHKSGHSVQYAAKFSQVLVRRKQKIRGLWKRATAFYARLNLPDQNSGINTDRLVSYRYRSLALAGWLNRHQNAVIDYQREENRVLLEMLDGKP